MDLSLILASMSAAIADPAHGCGTVGDECVAHVGVSVNRATIEPNGSADMHVEVSISDAPAGYTFGFDVTLNKIGGPASPVTVPPTAVRLEVTADPSGFGIGSADVPVSVPADVDATGVYEMQATVAAVAAAAYPGDLVSTTFTSRLTSIAGTTFGGAPLSPILQPFNGDLCVVPGGETVVALGFFDSTNNQYKGRFGGVFLDANGSNTTADFTGRTITEDVVRLDDSCFTMAVAKGYNPAADLCDNAVTEVFNNATWEIGRSVSPCPAAADGTWGTCCDPDYTADTIGRSTRCTKLYLRDYSSPVVPDPACAFEGTQKMNIDCRAGWGWTYEYVPEARTLGQILFRESVVPPASPIRYAESWRGDRNTDLRRDVPSGTPPAAVCTP